MRYIATALRQLVISRANDRCEYCQLSQARQAATFHIDHIIPVAVGGLTIAENLALACVSCSLRKSARLTAIDPVTGYEVTIYHPRQQIWFDHFRLADAYIEGITPVGRATVAALTMNRPIMVEIRKEEIALGRNSTT